MIIYLMRHGETEWNREGRLQGQSDVPLNALGLDLARKTAAGLRDVPFDAAFSSPLQRALVTAQIVVGDRKLPVLTDDRLKEIHFGAGEGAHFAAAKEDAGHPLHDFFCRPDRYCPAEGAETIGQAEARAESFLRDRLLPLEERCENVLVVAHGALNRCILNVIAGIPEKDFWRISLPNCAVSLLELDKGMLKVLEESKVYYDGPVNGRP